MPARCRAQAQLRAKALGRPVVIESHDHHQRSRSGKACQQCCRRSVSGASGAADSSGSRSRRKFPARFARAGIAASVDRQLPRVPGMNEAMRSGSRTSPARSFWRTSISTSCTRSAAAASPRRCSRPRDGCAGKAPAEHGFGRGSPAAAAMIRAPAPHRRLRDMHRPSINTAVRNRKSLSHAQVV